MLIFDDGNSGPDKAFPHLNEIGELECDVSLGGGSERRVDSEVELEIPGLKPDASTSTENLGLRDLLKSEQRTEKPTRLIFTTIGNSQLDVMNQRSHRRVPAVNSTARHEIGACETYLRRSNPEPR